jgi:membrane dipeptidase
MTPAPLIPVFDGHNDLLLRLWNAPGQRRRLFVQGEGRGHLDLPRMRAGGFAGGLFAIFVPPAASSASDLDRLDRMMDSPPYDVPLPAEAPQRQALAVAAVQAGELIGMARDAPDDFALCRSVAGIRAAMAAGRIAGVMHMEGAEAIDTGMDALHLFHAMGLRSLGPVWSRPNAFGHGVPFRFPSSPDTGPGLTEAGRRLVAECAGLRMVLDVSHLNEAGFWDVVALGLAPVVATHSNAHAVTPSSRNLTDRQLDAIRDSDGMVGLNFATVFLRPDGRRSPDMGWEPVLRHLDHLIGRLGEGRVGFGSDFDGATVPAPLRDVAGLPALVEALRAHGYGEALLARLCHGNWLDALARIGGEG